MPRCDHRRRRPRRHRDRAVRRASVTTETFRNAAHAAIAARTMPALAERLVIRPGSFGFDDVLVGAAARALDLELGIR